MACQGLTSLARGGGAHLALFCCLCLASLPLLVVQSEAATDIAYSRLLRQVEEVPPLALQQANSGARANGNDAHRHEEEEEEEEDDDDYNDKSNNARQEEKEEEVLPLDLQRIRDVSPLLPRLGGSLGGGGLG